MALTHYACTHCGGWILWFDTREPLFCPNCTDVRNALPQEDFTYIHIDQAREQFTTHWREALPGFWEFWTTPQLGLGSHGWLILRPEGNIAFEAAPHYTQAALDKIESLGGISILSASHPHGYGALWELQEAFQPKLIIHKDDLQHTKAFQVNHPMDDTEQLDDRRVMMRLGGHYDGQTALFDAEKKILFAGDALKIEFDEAGHAQALSCHKGFHYSIPLTYEELRRYRDVFAQFDFDHVCTPFEFGQGVSQRKAIALVQRLLDTEPHTQPIPINELL